MSIMRESDFEALCKKHGVTAIAVRASIRETKLKKQKSLIVVELRDKMDMTFAEIAEVLGYCDKSGARQAYIYAKERVL
jgi:hypothetical protein